MLIPAKNSEEKFLRQKFREYYSKNQVWEVPKISAREFGYGTYDKKIVNRHVHFNNFTELSTFLADQGPLHVSASVAYYENAGARTMQAMQWQYNDLIFEFDADALPLPCQQDHDFWECKACEKKGKGSKEACDDCGQKTIASHWVCKECLNATRDETRKLVYEFLLGDLGFKEDEVYLNFSGNRGYHVYIRSEKLKGVHKDGILEILNYIQGKGLNPSRHGFTFLREGKNQVLRGPKENALGWSGRLARSAKAYFETVTPERLSTDFNLSLRDAKTLLEKREDVLRGISDGYWDQVSFGKSKEKKALPEQFWSRVAKEFAVKSGADVDVQSSVDVHKIMRVPGSLHGSSGLKGFVFPLSKLEEVDPLNDSVVFSDAPVKVKALQAPKFSLNDQSFGPFEDEVVDLPEFAAVYLIARKAALLT